MRHARVSGRTIVLGMQSSGVFMVAAALLGCPATSMADGLEVQGNGARTGEAIVRAWTADEAPASPAIATRLHGTLDQTFEQRGRAARTAAGPNIGTVGIGAIGGLSDLEIGPSFRFWATDRVGVQAHLGFSGDDFGPDNVDFIRFEPTVIIAIGDFGDGAVNVRPYAGGGLRIVRTDVGPFNDSDVKPVGVGGVEFGFRGAPRFKVSTEVSLAPDIDIEEFGGRGPKVTGARVAALAHYFF